MMRLIRNLFRPLPRRHVPTNEQALLDQRRQLDEEIEAIERQNRQRSAIFLLEQEVQAVTAARYRRDTT